MTSSSDQGVPFPEIRELLHVARRFTANEVHFSFVCTAAAAFYEAARVLPVEPVIKKMAEEWFDMATRAWPEMASGNERISVEELRNWVASQLDVFSSALKSRGSPLDASYALAAQLLSDITSGDSKRIWSSSGAIIKLRDQCALECLATHIDEIRHSTEGISLGGAVFPNAEHLKTALRKLEIVRDHSGCLCQLYPTYLMFDPTKEAAAGDIHIEEVSYTQDKWVDAYTCVCTRCRARFLVEEREYHYTWWGWHLISSGA